MSYSSYIYTYVVYISFAFGSKVTSSCAWRLLAFPINPPVGGKLFFSPPRPLVSTNYCIFSTELK